MSKWIQGILIIFAILIVTRKTSKTKNTYKQSMYILIDTYDGVNLENHEFYKLRFRAGEALTCQIRSLMNATGRNPKRGGNS